MTLAEIRRLVTNYSGRTDPDFLNNVDDFIRIGHRYVERAWHGREQQFASWTYQVPLQPGNSAIPLPPQYRPSAELILHTAAPEDWATDRRVLERVPTAAMMTTEPWRLADGTTIPLENPFLLGEPRVFSVFGRVLFVRPSAASPKRLYVTATGWATPLTYDADETVVSQAAPDAVLYAALREAWSFLGDPVQKATWEGEATRAIEAWVRDGTHEEVGAHGLPLVMQVPG
jgi:hypothetical protein